MILDAANLVLFAFVLLGSKLVLGAIVLYMLLPKDRACAVCDSELIPLTAPTGFVRIMRAGRLQRLWCVECNRQSLGRRRGGLRVMPGHAARPVPELRPR